MQSSLMTASVITLVFCTSAMAEQRREADAHQHGHGVLNVALEGKTLEIEMETPGADILGFEHKAEAAEDKATVRAARETLGDPVALFGLPDAAGCSVTDAGIEIGADGEDHEGHEDEHSEDKHDHSDDEHGHKGEHDHKDEHDHDDDHAGEEDGHSEVHAHYTLTCKAPAKITGLDLGAFFAAFPNAEELDAAILTGDGQTSGEITPASPTLTF